MAPMPTRGWTRSWIVVLAPALFTLTIPACGSRPVGMTDTGIIADGGAVQDAAGDATDAGPADPITAPEEMWTWVAFPDSRCGNGVPTGIAVNRTSRSRRVLFWLEGGGACWDAATCFALRTAPTIESGYTEATYDGEIVLDS